MGELVGFTPQNEIPHTQFEGNLALMPTPQAELHVVADFTRRQEREPNFLSSAWLRKEVDREKHLAYFSGVTPWYHLSGTGFFVKEQVAQLLRNTHVASREFAPDVLRRELNKMAVDIRAFEDEYLKGLLGLRLRLGWQEIHGEKKIICPDYENATWESVTDKAEREGAVREAFFGSPETGKTGVEGFLRDAPENSLAIVVSSEGWSGLKDVEGRPITYPETQVYVVKKGQGDDLEQMTLRYKADIVQNEKLLCLLGQSVAPETDQKERIKQMIGNVTCIRGDDQDPQVRSFEDIAHLMQEAVGGRKVAYDGKTFSELFAVIRSPERFAGRNPLTEPLITRAQNYILDRLREQGSTEDLTKEFEIATGITIVDMYKVRLEGEEKSRRDDSSYTNQNIRRRADMQPASPYMGSDYQVYQELLTMLPGCAGGGTKTTVSSLGMPRVGEVNTTLNGSSTEDYDFDHEGDCVVCKQGPRSLGPCEICESCDAEMGGKAAKKWTA